MNNVNKTLYIPLYGKAYVRKQGLFLQDTKAEQIWEAEGFPLKGKAKSKWLAYYMGMRSAVFDLWLEEKLKAHPDAVVLHPGCGMDSRVLRVQSTAAAWFDLDFPEVVEERRRYFAESDRYHMVPSDVRDTGWLEAVPKDGHGILVMEGLSMYLQPEELKALLQAVRGHFSSVDILMDSYTVFAAKATKYKNPINEVGVTQVYGLDDPRELEEAGIRFVAEHELTPETMICQLKGLEQKFFRRMFAGKMAKKIYRLYEFTGV